MSNYVSTATATEISNNEEVKAVPKLKLKTRSFPNFSIRDILRWAWKLGKFIGKVIAGTITLFAIAHFVPELREKMPALYVLVDTILEYFDKFLMNLPGMWNFF